TVIVLFCTPLAFLLSNFALIKPVPPTGIGSFDQSGTVQPQDGRALSINRGASPTFLKVYVYSTERPSVIRPKSCSVFSNWITGKGPSGFCSAGWLVIPGT